MKKALLLLLTVIVAAVLVACGNSTNDSGLSNVSDTTANQAEAKQLNSTGKTIIFEPDVEDVLAVYEPDLIEAAGVLKRRLERAGYKDYEVTRDNSTKTVTAQFAEAVSLEAITELIKPARVISIRNDSGDVMLDADSFAYAAENVFETDTELQHIALHTMDDTSGIYEEFNSFGAVYMDDTLIAQDLSYDRFDIIFMIECTHEEAMELVTEINEGLRLPLRIVAIED